MEEKWVKLKGYNYEISNLGRVRNNKTKNVLKLGKSSTGYYRVSFSRGERGTQIIKFPHRLVAETFLENIGNKPQVNHMDGNKLNNKVNNLEWVTPKENMRHAIETGLFDVKKITKKATRESLKVTTIPTVVEDKIKGKKTIYSSISEASREENIPLTTFRRYLGSRKLLKGRYLLYKEDK